MRMKDNVRVKVCGIRSGDEAIIAVGSGADLLGLLLVEGRASLTSAKVRTAQEIRSRCPLADVVAVTRSSREVDVSYLASSGLFAYIQIHAPPPVQWLRDRATPLACGVVLVASERSWRSLKADEVRNVADFLLVDTTYGGGTGRRVPKDELNEVARWWGQNTSLIIGGGLHPGNVKAVVEQFRPAGVDVLSGVRDNAGRLSTEKVAAFVQQVRSA